MDFDFVQNWLLTASDVNANFHALSITSITSMFAVHIEWLMQDSFHPL